MKLLCMLWFTDSFSDSDSRSYESFAFYFAEITPWRSKNITQFPKIVPLFFFNEIFKYAWLKFKAIFFHQIDWHLLMFPRLLPDKRQYLYPPYLFPPLCPLYPPFMTVKNENMNFGKKKIKTHSV